MYGDVGIHYAEKFAGIHLGDFGENLVISMYEKSFKFNQKTQQ